jgi:hypothetical protein
MTTSDTCILLGLDRKVQIGQLRSNNTYVLKKSSMAQPPKIKEFIKLDADNVGMYAVASCKKKRDIHFIELATGNVVQSIQIGEIITAAKFSPCYKFLITSSASGCIMIFKVPNNVEREIMFKSNQKTLRITETPKAGVDKNSDGFSDSISDEPVEQAETLRKAWYEKDTEKPAIDFSRDTLPDWAKSTMGMGNEMEEAEFIYQPKNNAFNKLQATTSGDDEDEEEKSDFAQTLKTEGEVSEIGNHSDEDNDAFDFEQSRVRKTSVNPSEIHNRGSRIGNMIRKSVDTRDSIRMTVTEQNRDSIEVNCHLSKDLNEITEKSASKETTNKRTIQEIKDEEKRNSIIRNKAVPKSRCSLL